MGLQDFDALRKERAREREPLSFQLGGEVFDLPATLPAGALLDFIKIEVELLTLKPTTIEDYALAKGREHVAQRDFVLAVLSDEDAVRFNALLNRKDDAIDMEEDLEPVVNWLSEQYTGRPTERSSDSSDGPPPNGQTSSTGNSDSEVDASSISP